MAGHVFITRADIRRLACDAWLMPASIRARPNAANWLLAGQKKPNWPSPPLEWQQGKLRALKIDDWPTDIPRPWMVNVGGTATTPISWFVEGVQQFLDYACSDLQHQRTQTARGKPLIALPLVGTGKGGATVKAGEVVQALLPCLHEAADQHDVDLVLVAYEGPALAAAQAARWRLDQPRSWSELPEHLRREADRLAKLASRGELALFLGAGVSVSAGLPLWNELLERLAKLAAMPTTEVHALQSLDAMDQAAIIEGRLGGGDRLQEEIAALFRRDHHSLAHALLAALPVREAVTTNYDELFETAWRSCQRQPSVLPHAIVPGADCWLLKMHGCITLPGSIVLRREDYLGYAERRAALAGIVQAMLITRHMLFIGFSLRDDNFHRIADAVRRAVRGPGAPAGAVEPFGTTLAVQEQPLIRELWHKDLHWVSLADESTCVAAASRQLEILLDYLLACTRNSAHLLNDRYRSVLSDGELRLRQALLKFRECMPADIKTVPAWCPIEKLLEQMGLEAADKEEPTTAGDNG